MKFRIEVMTSQVGENDLPKLDGWVLVGASLQQSSLRTGQYEWHLLFQEAPRFKDVHVHTD